jgi:hypothetical protein
VKRIALVAALAACSSKKPEPPVRDDAAVAPRPVVPDQIRGTLALDGAPLAITACKPGRDTAIHVDLVTARGTLRWIAYEEHKVLWNGAPVACARLTRTWGGGTRPTDRTTYVRAQLGFECGPLRGELELECGNIDPFERKLLDESRQKHLEERGSGTGSAAAPAHDGSGH